MKNLYRNLRYYTKLGLSPWRKHLLDAGAPTFAVQRGSNANLHLHELAIEISSDQCFLLHGYADAKKLLKANAKFSQNKAGNLEIAVGGLAFSIKTVTDLNILSEIFVDGSYYLDGSSDALIIDVGMNVGYVSLFLAQQFANSQIYAYEPMAETRKMAEENFRLNPELATRIQVHDFGWADHDATIEVPYSSEHPGDASIFRPSERSRQSQETMASLQVRNCIEEFNRIRNLSPGLPIIMKIDCEGAEYQIIDALSKNNLLQHISLLIMEWHRLEDDQDPNRLLEQLKSSGFTCLRLNPYGIQNGLIYAHRLT